MTGEGWSEGTFLEQRVLTGERELEAATGFTASVSLGYSPWDETRIQGTVTWAPSEFEFQDDTPGGGIGLDQESLADVRSWVFGLEIVRFLVDENGTFAPYTLAGVAAGYWSLDERPIGAVTAASGDDTQWEIGGVGGVGVQIRASPSVAIQAEYANYSLGSPFDEDDGWWARVSGGTCAIPEGPRADTFDEPDRVSVRRFSQGLT